MPHLGTAELILILLLGLLLFGPTRLPRLGAAVGDAIRSLKRGVRTRDDIEIRPEDTPRRAGVEPDGDRG
ncbi:MAG: twin-arginine translocase TatA/TatE family subunit [Proteobacteria bacterium]|nr:twin-arginine translocase TatA/TatE family subunit [Pseudomonadota bacterium]